MSGNNSNQSGFTVLELLISTVVMGMLIIPATIVMIFFYGNALKNNLQSRLAVESQNILRSIVDELRVSASIREESTIVDPNKAGGWSTSEEDLILIIASPVIDDSDDFVIDSNTGLPYNNEIVYFADLENNILYKRILSNPNAAGNTLTTSCPAASADADCPQDVVLSRNFEDLSFELFSAGGITTTDIEEARSIQLNIDMQRNAYGQLITFENSMRVTLRNPTGVVD